MKKERHYVANLQDVSLRFIRNPMSAEAEAMMIPKIRTSETPGFLLSHIKSMLAPQAHLPAKNDADELFRCNAYKKSLWPLLEALPEALKNSEYFFIHLLRMTGSTDEFKYASDELKGKKMFLRELLMEFPKVFEFASQEIQNNPELALIAIKSLPCMMCCVGPDCVNSEEFLLKVATLSETMMCFASRKQTDNSAVVIPALMAFPMQLKHARMRFRDDSALVTELVKKDPRALRFASKKVKAIPGVVITALEAVELKVSCQEILKCAGQAVRDNPEVMLAAITLNKGQRLHNPSSVNALMSASERLKKSKRFVMRALRIDGWQLSSAVEFNSDREAVVEAVAECAEAIKFASNQNFSYKWAVQQEAFALPAARACRRQWVRVICASDQRESPRIEIIDPDIPAVALHMFFKIYVGLRKFVGGLIGRYYNCPANNHRRLLHEKDTARKTLAQERQDIEKCAHNPETQAALDQETGACETPKFQQFSKVMDLLYKYRYYIERLEEASPAQSLHINNLLIELLDNSTANLSFALKILKRTKASKNVMQHPFFSKILSSCVSSCEQAEREEAQARQPALRGYLL